jgi:hypothetical protein
VIWVWRIPGEPLADDVTRPRVWRYIAVGDPITRLAGGHMRVFHNAILAAHPPRADELEALRLEGWKLA